MLHNTKSEIYVIGGTLNETFKKNILAYLGTEQYEAFLQAMEKPPVVSIRLNLLKSRREPEGCHSVPWCSTGRYLQTRPIFTLDPAFHNGAYYVQEASSMALEMVYSHIHRDGHPWLAVDLCAAPGGKATHLRQLLTGGDLLIANEINPSRYQTLTEHIIRLGHTDVITCQSEPRALATSLEGMCDLLLCDVPCSGEGMFRKDPEAIRHWSEDAVTKCVLRQQDILTQAIKMLKPGGYLIYSTCTFNTRENEEQVEWMCHNMGMKTIQMPQPDDIGIMALENGWRFWPHLLQGEGLFYALLMKVSASDHLQTERNNGWNTNPVKETMVPDSFAAADPMVYFRTGKKETVRAMTTACFRQFESLMGHRHFRRIGCAVGTDLAGKNFVPEHEWALTYVSKPGVTQYPVDQATAIKYLRKEPLNLTNCHLGLQLICNDNNALGWIKAVPGRINNLLPHHWRIRMERRDLSS